MSVEYELKYITYVFWLSKKKKMTVPCLVFAFLEVDQQTYTNNNYCDYGS